MAFRPGVSAERAPMAGGVRELSLVVPLSSSWILAGGVSIGDTSMVGMSGVLVSLQSSPFGMTPFTGVTLPWLVWKNSEL